MTTQPDPKQIAAIVGANMTAMQKVLPAEFLEQLGATNFQICSTRSIRFDLPKPAADGTNRIKVTIEKGVFMVRGYRIEETEMLYDVPADLTQNAVKTIAGIK